jgi:DNA-binding NarL/FixJ family response regulator
MNTSARIKVLVADALPDRCERLGDTLQSCHRFDVRTAGSRHEALDLAESVQFDVGLISANVTSSCIDDISFMRELHIAHPALSLVVLLDSPERHLVVEAFRAGALGIFCRSHSFDTLCKCIRCIHAGQVWASSVELEFLVDALIDPVSVEARSWPNSRRLSRREQEISSLVAEGLSNRQISQRLNLSEHTIKNYLFRIFEKVGVSTRVELTLYALGREKTRQAKTDAPESMMQPEEFLLSET